MESSRRELLKASVSAATLIAAPALMTRTVLGADVPIVVGGLYDQSGPLGSSGVLMVNALSFAIDRLNEEGGLLGKKLKLVQYDTQSNIQMYSQFAQELSLKDKVDVVHGGITSSSREAVRPIFDRNKILYFYNVLYEGGVCDRNTFCTGTTPAQTVEKLVPYAMTRSGKRAYIVAADYNYGQITAKWMKKYVQHLGGEIVSTDFFPMDVTNFGPTVSKIQAAKPDLVLSALVGGNHTAFYRQWASAGMKAQIPIASSTFGLINEQETLDARESDGVYGSYGYFEELKTPASMKFAESLRKTFPKTPYISELGATTYEGFHLWAAGVRSAGSLDRMKVIEALEGGVSFDGPSGKVVLDHATHHTTRNAYVAVVKDKKWSVVETYEAQKPLDTAGACDLIMNPRDNQQYVIKI